MESAAFVLAVVMVTINLAIGLIAWGIREKMKTFVNHEECQKVRSSCMDGRSDMKSTLARIETKLDNLELRQNDSDRRQELILARLDQLPEKFVTIDRLRDIMHRSNQ
jgi:hypothetical protein